MANIINRQQTFSTNGTVTAAGLHNLIDTALVNSAIIKNQQEITTIGTADLLLIAPDSVDSSLAPRKVTVQNLLDDGLTAGTFTSFNLTGALTYGTATGNRTVSTSATITTGTIPSLTAGTTTSTAATITTGTIPTLTAGTTTGTAGIFTSGTVATLNSTTGTITNLSTTLAGDFTISQGTGTLGTSGVTLGTYGGATSIPTIVVDAKGRVTTASTSAVSGGGLTGFRNRIINGDMRIDQRNSGASVAWAANTSGYTIDRFKNTQNGSVASTVQRSTTVPTGYGFTNSLFTTVTTAEPAVATGNKTFGYYYNLEGYNVSDLGWGTASAQTITISFWVRSSVTGTFSFSVNNTAYARNYNTSYAISSPDIWEKKTFTIPGDTGATSIDTTNGNAIQLIFDLGFSTTYEGSTANTWLSSGAYALSGCTKLSSTLNATWYLTGLQLEAGSTATDFERRPIGIELPLCQRYYQKFSFANNEQVGNMSAYSTTGVAGMIKPWIFEMRATPTLEISSISNFAPSNSNAAVQGNFSGGNFTSYKYGIGSSTGISQGSANLVAGICSIVVATSSTAYLAGYAEL
jgi:hypothetical protein